jgi:hypothetical protein
MRSSRKLPFLGTARVRPLSQPTLSHSTPIATTALPFVVRLDAEGVRELRIVASAREKGTNDIHPGDAAPSGADLYLPF